MIVAPNTDLIDMAIFCINELDIDKDLNIFISLCRLKHDEAWGWTYDLDKDEIDVELDENLSRPNMLLTLCHEMVHVKQYSEDREANEEEALKLEEVLYNKYIKNNT